MANDNSDLDVFDSIAPKTQPSPDDLLEPEETTAPTRVMMGGTPRSVKPPPPPPASRPSLPALDAARLSSPSASRMPPPPPVSRPNVPSSAPGSAALLAGSGRVASSLPPPVAPPMRIGSVPPPPRRSAPVPPPQAAPSAPPPSAPSASSEPRPPMGSLRPMTLSSASEPPASDVAKPKSRAKLVLLAAAAMLSVAGVATGAMLLTPRTGSLKVYVAGPGGTDVGPVDIYVGEQKVCTSSPCFVKDLEPGIHDVYAESVGYAPAATKGVEITAGGTATFDVALAEPGTGIEVAASHDAITLHIDGKEIGPLPQKIGTLSPGDHTLRFVGSDRYEPVSRTVTVVPNKLENLGTIALPVAKGKATVDAASDVRVRLVPAAGDPIALEPGQTSMDLDPSKQWKLQACKPGHDMFETPVVFEAGKAEKTFRVELSGDGKGLPDWCGSKEKGRGGSTTTPAAPPAAGDGPGKVSFNSIPPGAAVLLDGRPVGRTPVSGVSVPPGSHSVVFIHPEKGRKAAGVTVKAGQSTGVGVRF